MTATTNATVAKQPLIKPIHVPKELWLASLLAMAFSYLLFSENGVLLTQNWEVLHATFHDGRHALGVACH